MGHFYLQAKTSSVGVTNCPKIHVCSTRTKHIALLMNSQKKSIHMPTARVVS